MGRRELPETYRIEDVEILATGAWRTESGKVVTFTLDHLKQIVASWQELKDRIRVPLKLGHPKGKSLGPFTSGFPSLGWLDDLNLVGERLVSSWDKVPRVLKELIDLGAYRTVSSELWTKWKDTVTNKVHDLLLTGVGILGAEIPAVNTLDDIRDLYAAAEPVVVLRSADADGAIAVAFSARGKRIIGQGAIALADLSLNRIQELVYAAIRERWPSPLYTDVWTKEVFEDRAIVNVDGRTLEVPYRLGEDRVVLGDPVEVEVQYVPVTPGRKEETMTPQEAEALRNEMASLRNQVTNLTTQVSTLTTERDAAIQRASGAELRLREQTVDALLDGLAREGRITRAQRPAIRARLVAADDTKKLTFTEGEGAAAKTVERTDYQIVVDELRARPVQVDLEERSKDGGEGPEVALTETQKAVRAQIRGAIVAPPKPAAAAS